MKKEIRIDGMHCQHCVSRVETALGELDSVKKVKVDLKKGIAKVDFSADVDNNVIKQTIEAIGFSVTDIK